MTKDSLIEVLRAHLSSRGLVLAHYSSGQHLTGTHETKALREFAELFADTQAPDPGRLIPRTTTQPMPERVLDHARALSRIL